MKGGRNVPMFDSFHVFNNSISLCLFKSVFIGADSSMYIERWKGICKQHRFFSLALAWRICTSVALSLSRQLERPFLGGFSCL